MPIDFACECGRQFRVKDELAGRSAKCPKCGRALVVPAAQFAPAPAAPTFNAGQQAYPAAGHAAGAGYQQPQAQQQWQAPSAGYAPSPGYAPSAGYAPSGYAGGYTPSAVQSGANIAGDFHRKSLFIVLGIILLLGFLLPVVHIVRDYSSYYSSSSSRYGGYSSNWNDVPKSYKAKWVNFEGLTEKDTPFFARYFCIAPFLAGIATLIVGGVSRGVVRGAVVGISGLLPFMILFLSVLVDSDMRGFRFGMRNSDSSAAWIGIMLAGFGTVTMLAGLLGARHRPDYRPLSLLALVGAILYGLYMFIPWGKEISSMPIVAPFSSAPGLSDLRGGTFLRICSIISTLGVVAATAMCITFGASNKLSRDRARLTFWILVGSTLLVLAGLLFMMFRNTDSDELVEAFSWIVKILFWIVGLMVLVPIGLSEMLLGFAARSRAAESMGRGFAVQMGAGGAGYAQPTQAQYPPGGYQQNPYPQNPYQR